MGGVSGRLAGRRGASVGRGGRDAKSAADRAAARTHGPSGEEAVLPARATHRKTKASPNFDESRPPLEGPSSTANLPVPEPSIPEDAKPRRGLGRRQVSRRGGLAGQSKGARSMILLGGPLVATTDGGEIENAAPTASGRHQRAKTPRPGRIPVGWNGIFFSRARAYRHHTVPRRSNARDEREEANMAVLEEKVIASWKVQRRVPSIEGTRFLAYLPPNLGPPATPTSEARIPWRAPGPSGRARRGRVARGPYQLRRSGQRGPKAHGDILGRSNRRRELVSAGVGGPSPALETPSPRSAHDRRWFGNRFR